MKRLLLLNIFVFAVCICALSQSSNTSVTFKNIIGPSPNAAAIEKFTNIPVSTYTGVPNIDIPIYTIVNNDLKLPISLSYHAGGIRVDEEASRVGLGWVLSAPPVISRSVNGNDDFGAVGYLTVTFPEFYGSDVAQFFKVTSAVATGGGCYKYIMGNYLNFFDYLLMAGLDEKFHPDLEPDVFSYNIPGYSGKFIIKKNRQIVKEKPDALKIELIETPSIKFQVIDPSGTKYIFDQAEHCVFSSAGGTNDYTTSWYLSKIVSLTGAEINFSYSSEGVGVRTLTSYNSKYNMFTKQIGPEPSCGAAIGIVNSYPPVKEYPLIYLNTITYPFGSVEFIYDNRIDIKYDKRLIKIKVNNQNDPTKNFSYDLVQDYFTTNMSTNGIPDPEVGMDQNLFDKRLKLTELVLRDANGNMEKKHQFTYNEQNLPSKKSFGRDHWGFFNGVTGNNTLLPNITFNDPFVPGQTTSYANGANRAPNPAYNQAFILTQIKYPTGGVSTFEYETNDFNAFKSTAGPNDPPIQLITETKEFFFRRGLDETATITFPERIAFSKIDVETYSENGQQNQFPFPFSDDAYLEIYPQGSSTYISRTLWGLESFFQSLGNYAYKRTDQFDFPAGTYTIKTHVASNVLFLNYIRVKFTYSYNKPLITDETAQPGGGLRVKKISDQDPVSTKTSTRVFKYGYQADKNNDGTPENYTYGRRLSKLRYTTHEVKLFCSGPTLPGAECDVFSLYSSSLIPLEGPIVGYDTTITLYGETGQNGKEEFYYENIPNTQVSYSYTYGGNQGSYDMEIRPSGVRDLTNLNNGALKKKITSRFNIATSSFETLHESQYIYTAPPEEAILGIRKVFTEQCSGDGCVWRLITYPVFQSSWIKTDQEITREYVPGTGTVFLETVKKYQYETANPQHYQPIETQTFTSKGEKKYQYTSYPSDYAAGTGFIDNMKAFNYHQPIEDVVIKEQGGNKYITAGTIMQYKNTIPLPDRIYRAEINAPVLLSGFKFSNRATGELPTAGTKTTYQPDAVYKQAMTFGQYDQSNNLTEQTKTDDIKKSYVWDYQRTYPICEATNAAVSEIAYTSFESDGAGSWNIGSAARTSNGITGAKAYQLGNGAVSRPGLNSGKEYIVSYWSTNGSYSVSGNTGTPVQGKTVTLNGVAWTYYEHRVSGIADLSVSGNGNIDELRLYPKGSQMTSYTYAPLIGITSQCDVGNHITYYEYDNFGRLKLIRDQDNSILKSFDYKYQEQQ